jgi:hypothetical protein
MALDPKEFSAVVKVRKGVIYPDLINSLALRNLPRETAEAEGWPTFYMPEPCANGHTAARMVKNSLCVDCWRVRQGRETIYPTAKNRTYYKQRDPAAAVAVTGAPVVIAPPAPPEPTKSEQAFLAKLAELKDIDKACAAVPGWTRGLVESRCSSNPAFKASYQDLTDRLGIATRAPDAVGSKFTPELERAFSRRYVDCGLVEQTRTELGVSASQYHEHLEKSPTFASLIAASEPLAKITLRDRATKEAAAGNDRLLKILEIDEPESFSNMSHEQLNAELRRLIAELDAKGILRASSPQIYEHRVTRQRIDLNDYRIALDSDNFALEPVVPNSDLVGGTSAPPFVRIN